MSLHSFVKYLRFTFIRENESNHAFVTREGVEIRPVLKVVEVLVELMLPYDAPCPIQIDQFKLESSLRILRERKATL